MNIYTLLMAKNSKYETFFPKVGASNTRGTSKYSQNKISDHTNKNKSIDDRKYRLTYNDILHTPSHKSYIQQQKKQEKLNQSKQMKTTFVKKPSEHVSKLNGYKNIKQIGKGGFAQVFQVIDQNGNTFAMKQYTLQASFDCYKNQCIVGEHFFDNGKLKNKFALKRGRNNLISFVQKFKVGKKGYIVQQMGGKSLSKMISQIQGVFHKGQRVYEVKFSKFYQQLAIDKKLAKLLLQIAEGIKLLNQQGFMHCDLKPQNILVNQNKNDLKIIDFGSSFAYCEGLPKITITPEYMPPELLETLISQNQSTKLNKIDVWSIGCILLEIITGIPLWFRYKCKINIKGKQTISLGFFALTNRQYHKIIRRQRELCENIKKIQLVFSEFEIYRKILTKILVFEESQRATINEVIQMLQKII